MDSLAASLSSAEGVALPFSFLLNSTGLENLNVSSIVSGFVTTFFNLLLFLLSSFFTIIDLNTTLVIFVGYLAYSWYRSLHEPIRVLHHKNDKLWSYVKHNDVFLKGYRPPAWMSFGSEFFVGSWHTVAHNIVRGVKATPNVTYSRELVTLSDSGTVGLDWAIASYDPLAGREYCSPDMSDDSFPIVFLHHGLCGCSRSHYVLSAVNGLLKSQKYRVVCLVARGCGKVPLTTPEGFIAARTLDMREALDRIFKRHPKSLVFGVGWSLGAGLMANYIGEESTKCKLSGAVIVSPCWDFMCRSPWFKIWSSMFLASSLVEYTRQNIEMFKKNTRVKWEFALKAKYIEEFDTHTVVPAFGFKDANEYYRKSSPLKVAHKITIPTLSLNADDDPVCSVAGCPTRRKQLGPGLVIARTKRGGHTSWAQAEGLDGYSSWMDGAVLAWTDACYDFANRSLIANDITFEKRRIQRALTSKSKSDWDVDRIEPETSFMHFESKLPKRQLSKAASDIISETDEFNEKVGILSKLETRAGNVYTRFKKTLQELKRKDMTKLVSENDTEKNILLGVLGSAFIYTTLKLVSKKFK